MNTTTEILQGAKDLLLKKGWNKFSYALTEDGRHTSYRDPNACSYCLVGAVWASHVSKFDGAVKQCGDVLFYLAKIMNQQSDYSSLFTFNDSPDRTKEEVIALLDKAITFSQSEGK